ncbi:Digestive organ expansion factor-like protein [Lamellibrachia satsuma]|nr:Digestive organ expansion factor-like protein [Lamellibrachia satsuma]
MGRGRKHHPGGRGQKRKGNGGIDKLSKKQMKHLKQYGELHPVDTSETGRERYQKIQPTFKINTTKIAEDSSSEEELDINPYQELLSSVSWNASHGQSEEEDDEDEDEAGTMDGEHADGDSASQGSTSHQVYNDMKNTESGDGEVTLEDRPEDDDYRNENCDLEEKDNSDNEEVALKDDDWFSRHFEVDLEESVAEKLAETEEPWLRDPVKMPHVGRCQLSWLPATQKVAPQFKEKTLRKLQVKKKLCEQLRPTNLRLTNASLSNTDDLTPLQHSIFTTLNGYQDLYYPERTRHNAEQLRLVYCLHAINHILKTRSRVMAHNAKIKARKDATLDDHRDQGLTRPKVLVVLPFKDSALRVVKLLSSLLMSEEQTCVMNKKRFYDDYGCKEEDKPKGPKGEDYEAIFAGNTEDHFRIGVSVSKKTLKLYTEFYNSDIILASPLGLRTIIGAEGETDRDFDFLSSIEILIFDQMDIYLMQNWDHIQHLTSHLHLQPKESHGVDFSRVRNWTLNGWGKYYRQTVILSSIVTPEINSVFNKHCHNYGGKILVPKSPTTGSICEIVTTLPQVFQRVQADNFASLPDARFEQFTTKVLPQYRDSLMSHTMIFVPSYFDYVRLRNYFKKHDLDFMSICEYSSDKHISRSRTHFFHGKTHFLLYTERLHFYRRFRLRGVHHVIFYELPLYASFYTDVCNMLTDPRRAAAAAVDHFTCTVLYSRYDGHRLAAVVGSDRASYMITSQKGVHMFVTGKDS